MNSNVKWFYTISATLLALIFVIDIYTPHGWADFIFYFLPIAVLIFAGNAVLPLVAAAVTTVFIVVGYEISPEGADAPLAITNRAYALVSMWIMAFIIRMTIMNRNSVNRHAWIMAGRASVAESLKGEHSVSELMNRATAAISQYLGAQVAAVYFSNPDETDVFTLSGGYSLPESLKYNPKRIHLHEGVVGQVAFDQVIRKLDLPPPEINLTIRTGLQTIPSHHIIIAPLTSDGETNGVLELGFTSEPHEATIDLLKSTSELFSAAVRTAQNRERLRELLAETQRMAEELQAQQEELRVSNEELEQQSRALQESQGRLENNQAELEQTNQQLEEQMQELERQKLILNEKNDQLIRIQRELEKQSEDLQRSTQYKSEFLANMSHELRTPLNSSLILAKLLRDNKEGNLTEEQRRFADTIYTAGNDLLNLINDILDLSKIEAGKLEVRPERVSVQALISSIEKYFQPVAQQKKLGFKIERHPEAVTEFITDRQRLEQILKNFLSNAFKFTEKGEVNLIIRPSESGIQFEVKDTGIGIPAHQQEIIFEAFRQADGTTNRKFGGTGLGLSISKELAQLLNGQISLESEVGKGSRFFLNLPLDFNVSASSPEPAITTTVSPAPSTPPTLPAATRKEPKVLGFTDDREKLGRKKRVLIVEDDAAFARVLFDLAHEMDFDAVVATSADEGVMLALEANPHAILLDVRLPDHSGMAVLDQLKRNSKTRHIPVHMISGQDFSQTAFHMGAAGYLLKPVEREQLVKAFETLDRRMEAVRRVLIVEDNKAQRESMESLIADKGVEIVSVDSAEKALEELETKEMDCIIMDLSLPGMSGLEFLEKMAQRDQTEHQYPPVIVYTGRDLTIEEEMQLKRYSDSIIVKGARSPERLLSEVTLFLHRVESELPADRQKMLFEMRSREKTLENKKILVVDDDVRNIFALTSLLEHQGAKIEIARNGKEALEKLNKTPDADLVLMDIMMPEMDGYEATRKIREQNRFAKLPIIAVTAKAMQDDQERCLQAGANDYLAKPINSDKLLSLIRVWLPTSRGKQH